jgi:hypothetical protein
MGAANPQPLSPTPPVVSPIVDTSPSACQDTAADRLSELMEKAHSRTGVNAWEIAEIAKLRNISPWAPVAKIIAR